MQILLCTIICSHCMRSKTTRRLCSPFFVERKPILTSSTLITSVVAIIVQTLRFALRLCSQNEKSRACVLIYSKMKLYEEAVELALRVELQLAQQIAERVRE